MFFDHPNKPPPTGGPFTSWLYLAYKSANAKGWIGYGRLDQHAMFSNVVPTQCHHRDLIGMNISTNFSFVAGISDVVPAKNSRTVIFRTSLGV